MAKGRIVYIGLGSNLGDREANIRAAVSELSGIDGVKVIRVSGLRETEPLGPSDQPRYLNVVSEVEVSISASELLDLLQGVERKLGRVRVEKWGARTIDLDILLFGDEIIEQDDLVVPPMNSILFYQALLKHQVKGSLHIFPQGHHSIALRNNPGSTNQWTTLCEAWFKEIGVIK